MTAFWFGAMGSVIGWVAGYRSAIGDARRRARLELAPPGVRYAAHRWARLNGHAVEPPDCRCPGCLTVQ